MKKVIAGAFAVLVIASFFITEDDVSAEQGSIKVYFCPRDDCETAFVQFLDSAQNSIHCALFDIGLESVQNKLIEKSQQLDVKVVTDDQYYHKFSKPFVKKDSFGLMHNKFCIVDNKVSTGSMNPTVNGVSKNNNNLLIIEHSGILDNFEAEFEELWNGDFKRGKNVNKQYEIETYFCPEDDCSLAVREELKKAKSSIYFMTFSFTNEGIANVLLLKHLDGIEIKGIMEAKQVSKYSQFDRLKYHGVDVIKDNNPSNMHHKVFIIDSEKVITGSFNPTEGGDKRNDENVIIIRNKEIAEYFRDEFNTLYLKK